MHFSEAAMLAWCCVMALLAGIAGVFLANYIFLLIVGVFSWLM